MDAWLQPINFGSMSVCLNIPKFAFVCIYDFTEYVFGMNSFDVIVVGEKVKTIIILRGRSI